MFLCCDYCTRSHTGAARKLGMTDAEYGELLAVVGMFNQTNALAEAYKIPVDDVFLRPWSDPQER
ncbi:MAG: carboxymuconolactone decarboxylase family protein [Thalassobaculum sp.]